jgi:hypothetical protein
MSLRAPNALGMLADRLDPPKSDYVGRPSDWAKDRLDEHMTVKQREIQESVVEHRHVVVHSCNSAGKSFSMSRLAAWWIDSHDPGEAFVISTAPTWSQVETILWRELNRAHRKGKLQGRVTANCEWKLDLGSGPDEIVAYGRKPADYDDQSFLGIHQRYVLVIIDEGCGVPQGIYDAAESLASNQHARIIAVGNPDDPSSYFAKICMPGSGWHVIGVDAFTTPNFTAEEVNKYPAIRRMMIREGIRPSSEPVPERTRDLLVSPLWVNERIQRWGEGSPLFESRVRGRFPKVTNNTLIHPHWVNLACQRELIPDVNDPYFGVDVARYGVDHSIIMLRQGGVCRVVEDIAYGPVTELAGRVQLLGSQQKHRPIANVDDTGVGGGVTDILMQEGYPVHAVNSSGACSPDEKLPSGKPRFYNARSEMWWRLREYLAGPSGDGSDGRLDLDPEDDDLIAQIVAVRYKVNSHGQIVVESKDDMKSRRLPSPDRGDALVYSLVKSREAELTILMKEVIMGDILEKEW